MKQLKEKIWPKIRKELPDAIMHIYGAYPSQKVLQLHNAKENFIIHGRAENSNDVIINAKVLLAPIRFGAGLKGKLLEAMQMGTPSVTTNTGAEGISDINEWSGFIEDDWDEFAAKSIQLYIEETQWNLAQKKGFQILKKFDRTHFKFSFFEKLTTLNHSLLEFRIQNFIGSLLLHHTTQSTKFMSKWIEEKNK